MGVSNQRSPGMKAQILLGCFSVDSTLILGTSACVMCVQDAGFLDVVMQQAVDPACCLDDPMDAVAVLGNPCFVRP